MFLLSTIGGSNDLPLLYLYLLLFGLGMGACSTTIMVAVQSVTPPEHMGMTTSAVTLVRNIGSTVGTAFFGMVISGTMDHRF